MTTQPLVDGAELGLIPLQENETRTPEDIINQRIHEATILSTISILNYQVDSILSTGLMAGGKSRFLYETITELRNNPEFLSEGEERIIADDGRRKVHVFKLPGDDRSENSEYFITYREGFDENGNLRKGQIRAELAIEEKRNDGKDNNLKSINHIFNKIESGKIRSGDVLAVSELQFMGDPPDVYALVEECRNNGIIIIGDMLGAYFNTRDVEEVEEFLKSSRDNNGRNLAFKFESFNSFNKNEFAEMVMRGVGVEYKIEDDEIVFLNNLVHNEKNHYNNGINKSISEIAYEFYSKYKDNKNVMKSLFTKENGINIFLLPSFKTDQEYAIGMERYIPTTRKFYVEFVNTVEPDTIREEDLTPISQLYSEYDFHQWAA